MCSIDNGTNYIIVFSFPENNLSEAEELLDNITFLGFIKIIDYQSYPELAFVKVSDILHDFELLILHKYSPSSLHRKMCQRFSNRR